MELDQENKGHGRIPTIGEEDKVPDKQPDDGDGGGDGGGDDDDDEGTRQPYNCTFCRRGFPTAQALGGHMNVHRKDRVVRPATATATVTSPAVTRGYHEQLVAFTVYGQVHPASSTSSESLFHAERAPQELRLFGRDGGRSRNSGDVGDRREYRDGGDEGKEELDLELRLGGAS